MSTILMHIYDPSFKLRAMDCANTPVAVAAGSYEKENYYYYAFLYACCKRWIMEKDEYGWDVTRNLVPLGLSAVHHIAETVEDAIAEMSELVRQDKPVMLFIPYNRLFYTVDYNGGNAAGHGLLFIGHYEERDTFTIMDSVQMWGANQEFSGASETFIRMPLSRAVFELLLTDAGRGFEDKNGSFAISFYSIERVAQTQIHCYTDLFQTAFPDGSGMPQSRLLRLIDDLAQYRAQAGENPYLATHLRQELNGTNDIVMYALEHLLLEKAGGEEVFREYEALKQRYLHCFDRCTMRILKAMMSSRLPDDKSIAEIRDEVAGAENALFAFLFRVRALPKRSTDSDLLNLTAYAQVSADSGSPLVVHPGKADATVWWDSSVLPCDHWLLLDLGTERTVVTIDILHSGISGLVTADYLVQTSLDGVAFETEFDVRGNVSARTVYRLQDKRCRYVRLYVSKASEYECNTKIKGFQVLGV